jgi:hypothetical protein
MSRAMWWLPVARDLEALFVGCRRERLLGEMMTWPDPRSLSWSVGSSKQEKLQYSREWTTHIAGLAMPSCTNLEAKDVEGAIEMASKHSYFSRRQKWIHALIAQAWFNDWRKAYPPSPHYESRVGPGSHLSSYMVCEAQIVSNRN